MKKGLIIDKNLKKIAYKFDDFIISLEDNQQYIFCNIDLDIQNITFYLLSNLDNYIDKFDLLDKFLYEEFFFGNKSYKFDFDKKYFFSDDYKILGVGFYKNYLQNNIDNIFLSLPPK